MNYFDGNSRRSGHRYGADLRPLYGPVKITALRPSCLKKMQIVRILLLRAYRQGKVPGFSIAPIVVFEHIFFVFQYAPDDQVLRQYIGEHDQKAGMDDGFEKLVDGDHGIRHNKQ